MTPTFNHLLPCFKTLKLDKAHTTDTERNPLRIASQIRLWDIFASPLRLFSFFALLRTLMTRISILRGWSLALSRSRHLLPISRILAQDLLPIELWDLVLDSLSNEDLLRTSCVCQVLNVCSITMYLRRYNVDAASATFPVHSHLLKALHLALVTPQVEILRCNFSSFNVLQNMRFLREVVARWQNLTEISLDWRHDLFYVHRYDFRQRNVSYARKASMAIFRDVLRAFADKTHDPVIVVASSSIYKFRPEEISRWQLRDRSHVSLGPFRLKIPAWFSPTRAMDDPLFSLPLRGHNKKFFHLDQVHAVDARSIRAGSGQPEPLDSFTLITFPTTSLALEPSPALPAAALSKILPHIVLPSLHSVDLCTAEIEPIALHQFLVQHMHIRHIGLCRSGAMGRTLCIPSLELPNLTRLHADDGIGLIALLDAFDSPSVSILGIRITRPDTLHVAGLKSALRRISLRTQPTKLELKLSLMCADHIPLDDEERTIVSALYCVDCVRLVTDRVGEARSILPWLKMLPALRRLELSHLVLRNNSPSSDRNDPELVAFMEDARTALPWVSEVHLAYGGNTVS